MLTATQQFAYLVKRIGRTEVGLLKHILTAKMLKYWVIGYPHTKTGRSQHQAIVTYNTPVPLSISINEPAGSTDIVSQSQ